MNEAVLMAHLRELARSDSAQAIEIARAGNKKFPDSPDAPERTSILIHALITQDKLSEGRAEAEYMVNHTRTRSGCVTSKASPAPTANATSASTTPASWSTINSWVLPGWLPPLRSSRQRRP